MQFRFIRDTLRYDPKTLSSVISGLGKILNPKFQYTPWSCIVCVPDPNELVLLHC